MSNGELQAIESERLALLGQLTAAESALRRGLHTHGFGSTARAHLERAMAHICEAYLAINEGKSVRSVHQLVNDITRFQQVMDDVRQRKSQRI